MYKETLSEGQYTQSEISGSFATPAGIAVDGSGNLYVSDRGAASPSLYKETLANGTYTQTTISDGFVYPQGVAVDGGGNVYLADEYGQAVYKETLSNGSYTQSTIDSWAQPVGVAVDSIGNLYVADRAYVAVQSNPSQYQDIGSFFIELYSSGAYTFGVYAPNVQTPYAIAVDGSGSVYGVDQGNIFCCGGDVPAAVSKYTAALGPSLNFPAKAYGVSPNFYEETVTIANFGTAALNFSLVAYPPDFPEQSGVATDCKSTTSLAVGALCALSIDFVPSQPLGNEPGHAFSEDVAVTTNTGNISGTVSQVAVTGTEEHSSSLVVTASVNPAASGSQVTYTATVTAGDGTTSITPTGTVFFSVDSYTYFATAPLSGGTATYTVGLDLGTHTIQAFYYGDSSFLSSESTILTENVVPAWVISDFGDVSIAPETLGSSSNAIPLTITFNQLETLTSISVLTEGIPNLDFTQAPGGTCATGTAYAATATCTVNVAFSPKAAGARYGAVVLADSGGVVATGYLEGTGQAAKTAFLPGVVSTIAGPFNHVTGEFVNIAVDAGGNLFVTNAESEQSGYLYKETLSAGKYTQTTISSVVWAESLAIDGSGSLYLGGQYGQFLEGVCLEDKETLLGGAYWLTQFGNICDDGSFAVDADENVYVSGIAVDGNGNVSRRPPAARRQ